MTYRQHITAASKRVTSLPAHVKAVRAKDAAALERKFQARREWMKQRGIGQ